jgi:hypothetical protein
VSQGQTTYEFIMNQHKKQQERQRQRREKTPTSTNNNSPASAQPRTRSRVSDEEAPTAEMKTYQATRVEGPVAAAPAAPAADKNGAHKDFDAQASSSNDV